MPRLRHKSLQQCLGVFLKRSWALKWLTEHQNPCPSNPSADRLNGGEQRPQALDIRRRAQKVSRHSHDARRKAGVLRIQEMADIGNLTNN